MFVGLSTALALVACVSGLYADATERPWVRKYWEIEKPLYRELFSNQPKTYPDEPGFIWPHMFERTLPLFAMQYGMPYSVQNTAARLGRHHLNVYVQGSLRDNLPAHVQKLFRKHGVQLVMYSDVHYAGNQVNPYLTKQAVTLILDPTNIRRLQESTIESYNRYPDLFWALSLGDEPISAMKRNFYDFIDEGSDYPFLRQGLTQIKAKYGFGKFGVPSGRKAENEPLNWIAFNRWFHDHWLNVVKAFSETTRSLNPGMPVVGEDSVSRLRNTVFERSARYVDISTGQNHPGKSPFRQELGFKTKVQRDLTMKDVWLTPHISNFDGMHTPAQIVSFLSEIARVGGTGLQLWLYDHHGSKRKTNFTFYDYYGAPGRWQAIMHCLDRFREMPRLRFPTPDTAIFFSNDACWSRDRAVYFHPHYEGAFTFLGPFAGAWFEFVSDEHIRGKMKSLEKFDHLFIPYATFQDRAVSEHVTAVVESGTDVVCGDPQVFRYHLDGSETPQFMQRMFGVRLDGLRPFPAQVVLHANAVWPTVKEGQVLPVFGPTTRQEQEVYGNAEDALQLPPDTPRAFRISVDAGATVLGAYPDGSPAIVLKKHGRNPANSQRDPFRENPCFQGTHGYTDDRFHR